MEKKSAKRPRGRPPGREFTHEARVMMRPDTWEQLGKAAEAEGKSAAEIIRGLVDRWLKRRGA